MFDPSAGSERRRRAKLPLDAPTSAPAKVGLVVVLAGLILAILWWIGVVGGAHTSVDTSSRSYIDGSKFATINFSVDAAVRTVCVTSHVSRSDVATQWLQGCRNTWEIDRLDINARSGGGGVIP